jgi:hypothetical protein
MSAKYWIDRRSVANFLEAQSIGYCVSRIAQLTSTLWGLKACIENIVHDYFFGIKKAA